MRVKIEQLDISLGGIHSITLAVSRDRGTRLGVLYADREWVGWLDANKAEPETRWVTWMELIWWFRRRWMDCDDREDW
jgi:hypothetical protein